MKNNKKILLVCVGLFVIGGKSLADTKIGIGTGVSSSFSRSNSAVISMPIKFDSYMMIEPYAGYRKTSEDVDRNLPDYYVRNSEAYQLGVGLYGISKLSTDFELYYGGALAAGKSEWNSQRKDTNTFIDETSVYFYQNESKATEYMIKPTLGISYLINENFSFSLDAGIYYSWGKDERKDITTRSSSSYTEESEYTVDLERVDTFTRFMFRMVF